MLDILSEDSKGFALSLDLLLAIIPLTLVLGFVAADMDNILYQMEDTVFRGATDRAASDAVTTLVTTSGDPYDWETNTSVSTNNIVAGLAQYDTSKGAPIEGVIDPIKLASLNDTHMQSLVGSNYQYYLSVTTINKTAPMTLKLMGNTSYTNAKDVVKVERVVLSSKLKVVSSMISQIRYSGASQIYTIPSFQTSTISINSYDYWILIAKNQGFTAASVSVNNNMINFTSTNINTPQKIDPTFLNNNTSTPNKYFDNIVTLNATGSFLSSMDFYIVQTPKGTIASEINNDTVLPQKSRFDLYLWVN